MRINDVNKTMKAIEFIYDVAFQDDDGEGATLATATVCTMIEIIAKAQKAKPAEVAKLIYEQIAMLNEYLENGGEL